MLNNLSEEARALHAVNCARQTATQTDANLKQDFLQLERSWLSLARSYEFSDG